MKRTIAAEHRKLEGLFADTREALRSGEAAEAGRAFAGLREAIEIHFEQESLLYYPTIWNLLPQFEQRLRGLVATHESFEAQFEEIAARIATGAVSEASRAFERFAAGFASHETQEERLLESIEAELRAHAPGGASHPGGPDTR